MFTKEDLTKLEQQLRRLAQEAQEDPTPNAQGGENSSWESTESESTSQNFGSHTTFLFSLKFAAEQSPRKGAVYVNSFSVPERDLQDSITGIAQLLNFTQL